MSRGNDENKLIRAALTTQDQAMFYIESLPGFIVDKGRFLFFLGQNSSKLSKQYLCIHCSQSEIQYT